MNINSLSLPDKTVQVTPEVMRVAGWIMRERERSD